MPSSKHDTPTPTAARRLPLTQETKAAIDAAISRTIQRVAEYDDRTSPEDWPEAMLITGDELEAELRQFALEILGVSST